jgi:hypothetical protein
MAFLGYYPFALDEEDLARRTGRHVFAGEPCQAYGFGQTPQV